MSLCLLTWAMFVMGVFFLHQPKDANACIPHGCHCVYQLRDDRIVQILNEHTQTRQFITEQFRIHQNWLFGANGVTDSFFHDYILPALMMMTEQLTVNATAQMFAIGTFFDAKNQLETQRIYQVKAAEAHKDYHPSFQMCVIGTNTRSLAASHRNSEFTRYVLGKRSLERGLGMFVQSSAYDSTEDRENRLHHFITRYCDPHDNNDVTEMLCFMTPNRYAVNKDIDFARTLDSVKTLNIDFTDNDASLPDIDSDERDVMALASNIYNSDVFNRFSDQENLVAGQESVLLDMRSVAAKRNVIENSYNAIVGLKTAGTERSMISTLDFTTEILEQLGVSDLNDRRHMIAGNAILEHAGLDTQVPGSRPSYYAQLELLTQKIYQNPEFFISLYDKPANVNRKDVAMQAIGLMLNREMFESELRSEMTMAVMLELQILKYQADIQNRIGILVDE